jgi:hypothetical protein
MLLFCCCEKRYNYTEAKGYYTNTIYVSDTNAEIHIGDTLIFSINVPKPILTSQNESIDYLSLNYTRSIALTKYDYSGTIGGNGIKTFFPYSGFVYGNAEGYKSKSQFDFNKLPYRDYFIAKDTGVYFANIAPQQEYIEAIAGTKKVTTISCFTRFSVVNTHRAIAESVHPDYETYCNYLDSAKAGYYCWRVVP